VGLPLEKQPDRAGVRGFGGRLSAPATNGPSERVNDALSVPDGSRKAANPARFGSTDPGRKAAHRIMLNICVRDRIRC
jgi:hypothetical protein